MNISVICEGAHSPGSRIGASVLLAFVLLLPGLVLPQVIASQTTPKHDTPSASGNLGTIHASDSPDWVRPQDRPAEPWPGRTHDLLHMQRLAIRGGLEDQRNALQLLGQQIKADRIRASDIEVMSFLEKMVLTGIRTERRNPGNPADSSHARVLLRAEAVQLLASIGGPEIEPILVELLGKEKDALVLAFAVAAAREIGKAPGRALETQLTAVAQTNNSLMRDEALTRELIQTTVQFYIRYSHTVDAGMFREILRMAQNADAFSTRRQAAEAIRTLRGIPE